MPGAGGFTFAEDPGLAAPEARLIWRAELDPGTLPVIALGADPSDPDSILVERIVPWLTVAVDPAGHEHAVLSDGWHHIRLDIEEGRLAGEAAVLLHYRLHGLASAEARLLPLRRLIDLCRHGRFARSLFPRDPRIERGIAMLRVHDALGEGASQREIGMALFGRERVATDWNHRSDSLRSRVRRLVREARAMARGGYRHLLHDRR
ncbi:DNA -binding domain-containing protein [Novosphingobium fluoreni]|uniref:DNA -binding domain-containing protein n=1 Tax=Novosphingobium fluoreni TaxID=1391222 RepID=UPI003DA0BA3F